MLNHTGAFCSFLASAKHEVLKIEVADSSKPLVPIKIHGVICQQTLIYSSVSQPPGRGPVPGPGINYAGPREILLELITNLNVILYLSTCHAVHISVQILFMIMP